MYKDIKNVIYDDPFINSPECFNLLIKSKGLPESTLEIGGIKDRQWMILYYIFNSTYDRHWERIKYHEEHGIEIHDYDTNIDTSTIKDFKFDIYNGVFDHQIIESRAAYAKEEPMKYKQITRLETFDMEEFTRSLSDKDYNHNLIEKSLLGDDIICKKISDPYLEYGKYGFRWDFLYRVYTGVGYNDGYIELFLYSLSKQNNIGYILNIFITKNIRKLLSHNLLSDKLGSSRMRIFDAESKLKTNMLILMKYLFINGIFITEDIINILTNVIYADFYNIFEWLRENGTRTFTSIINFEFKIMQYRTGNYCNAKYEDLSETE